MDIISAVIGLISGAVGGNVAGAAMPDKSLGAVGNSITGLIGGGLGNTILQALNVLHTSGGLDLGSILANVGTSGVGGAVLLAIVALVKSHMQPK